VSSPCLFSVIDAQYCTGLIEILGRINTDGNRGCGEGNDSGGGGAGGTVFIISPVGLNVNQATTRISANGPFVVPRHR
jgi:hypothetical protein